MAKIQDTVDRNAATLQALVRTFAGEGGDRPDLFTDAEWEAIRREAAGELQTSRILHRAAMRGRVDASTLAIIVNRARVSGLARAPLILDRAVELALRGTSDDNVQARLCLGLLKGFGVLVPSKPVDEEERQKATVAAALIGGMSSGELNEVVRQRIEKHRRAREAKASGEGADAA